MSCNISKLAGYHSKFLLYVTYPASANSTNFSSTENIFPLWPIIHWQHPLTILCIVFRLHVKHLITCKIKQQHDNSTNSFIMLFRQHIETRCLPMQCKNEAKFANTTYHQFIKFEFIGCSTERKFAKL